VLTYVLIGAAVLAVLIAARDIRITLTNRRVASMLVPHVRAMRKVAHEVVTYRPPRADEPIPADARPLFEAAQQEITAAGLSVLGDLMEIHPDGTPFAPTRWFIDGSRAICGWFGVLRNRETGTMTPVMVLFSESASGHFFSTGRGVPSTALAQPPTNHRAFGEWDDGLATTIERHRALLAGEGMTARGQDASLDAGPALVGRLRNSTARWRAAQPHQELLERDVRAVVEDKWEYLGPTVLRLMSGDMTES
jgi:hypothetical protein